MSPRTPLEAWPRQQRRGRPGYSARHFAAVSPPADTPLSVAHTLADRARRAAVADETERRLKDGEDPAAVMAWQSEQFSAAKAMERCAELDGSFERVIALLEAAPQFPAMKALVRQAKRAQRLKGG